MLVLIRKVMLLGLMFAFLMQAHAANTMIGSPMPADCMMNMMHGDGDTNSGSQCECGMDSVQCERCCQDILNAGTAILTVAAPCASGMRKNLLHHRHTDNLHGVALSTPSPPPIFS